MDLFRGELELLFLGSLEEVSEAFPFAGECCTKVKGALEGLMYGVQGFS